jgi:hypothetical protein
MRRLILGSAALTIALGGVALCAVLAGRSQPPPEQIAMLHLTDCELPCWIGIVPGQTTISEARQRIEGVYGAKPKYAVERTDFGFLIKSKGDTSFGLAALVKARADLHDSDKVESLTMAFFYNAGPKIAELYSLFGMPKQWYGSGDNWPILTTDRQVMIILARNRCVRITTEQRVALFIFRQDTDPGPVAGQTMPWRGFGSCFR